MLARPLRLQIGLRTRPSLVLEGLSVSGIGQVELVRQMTSCNWRCCCCFCCCCYCICCYCCCWCCYYCKGFDRTSNPNWWPTQKKQILIWSSMPESNRKLSKSDSKLRTIPWGRCCSRFRRKTRRNPNLIETEKNGNLFNFHYIVVV